MDLVEFKCGCIGFKPDADGKAWVVSTCDGCLHDNYYTLILRKNMNVTYTRLSAEDKDEAIENLKDLIEDGYDMREMRSLLRSR